MAVNDPTSIQTTGPAVVTGPAEITPGGGGLIGEAEAALIATPNALLIGLAAILTVLLLVFVYLVVAAVSANNGTAQRYLVDIFTAYTVWAVFAAVAGVGLYLAPSPVKK